MDDKFHNFIKTPKMIAEENHNILLNIELLPDIFEMVNIEWDMMDEKEQLELTLVLGAILVNEILDMDY